MPILLHGREHRGLPAEAVLDVVLLPGFEMVFAVGLTPGFTSCFAVVLVGFG